VKMLYDAAMIALIVTATAAAIWAGQQMSKAAKEGKLYVIGVMTKETRMDDSDRIDWLAANPDMLQGVRWRMQSQGNTLREAIDFLARMKNEPK